MIRSFMLGLTLTAMLCGCSSTAFRAEQLFKTDIDYVADAHLNFSEELLEELLTKLYLRNPRQLRRATPGTTVEIRRQQIFAHRGRVSFAELGGRQESEAVLLGLDPEWHGDRVFAVMVGLVGMMRRSYDYQEEFFLLSDYDQQRLYNSARNVEILIWQLNNRVDSKGRRLMLTNSENPRKPNLSFERLFGKLIANQDLLAHITASRTNRTISKVAQSVATAAFLP